MHRAQLTALSLVLSTLLASPALAQTDALVESETAPEAPPSEAPPSEAPSEDESVASVSDADLNVSVESAEHLSSSLSATSEGAGGADSEAEPQVRRSRLIFVAEGRESLRHMLELQLPDWRVRQVEAAPTYLRIRRAQAQLMPTDAVVWIERTDDIERVALLDGAGDTPRSSTLPAAEGEDWARTFALVVEGLIREQAMAASEEEAAVVRTPPATCIEDGTGLWGTFIDERGPSTRRSREHQPRRDWWPTPIARDGWMFRFGWTHWFAPRRSVGRAGGFSVYDYPSGGLRIAAGRWLHRNVRVSLIGELARIQGEPEGALGLQAMVLSSTRFRMGVGAEFAALIVSENDGASGNRFGRVGYRIGLPLEIGFEVNRKGGFFFHIGPTWTKAPYAGPHPGYQMSVEWEFN